MNHEHLEQDIEKKFAKRTTKKKRKMGVTGKSIFQLQRLMTERKIERVQKFNKKAHTSPNKKRS